MAFIAHGDDKGKLCVIVDVVDQNRVICCGLFSFLTLKMPRKPASENVCFCRLLNILKFSNLFLHTGKQCGL